MQSASSHGDFCAEWESQKKVKDLDDINLLQMEINFSPRGAEISGGGWN